MLVGDPLPGEPSCAPRELENPAHPRIAYARRGRDGVRAWAADGGVPALGRGVAGRLEVSVEVDAGARHRGPGRLLVTAARQPAGEPLWARVAPGDARALRVLQAAGYRPVGAELLLQREAPA